jgi:putative DNA primase/helicase
LPSGEVRVDRLGLYQPQLVDTLRKGRAQPACIRKKVQKEGRKFREHRREDYALFSVAFDFDPDARAEIWEAAFKGRLGGSWAFLQEYAGYSLTSRTDLEAAAFLVGPPGCGKSTFIEGVEMVAGDQAGTLSLSDMERSLYALSNIGGKTLLTATEAPHLYLKSTATLDALISGEKLQIERKYQQPERVRPVAKILWAMNELPQVRNPSAGLFRRAHIVPFPAVQGKRKPLVKELIKMEGSGILNWTLDGLDCLEAQRCFSISPEMREAKDNFKAGNDVPAAFVEECCKVDPVRREESNLLYLKYKEWCLDNGYKPLASNRIRHEWERLGFERKTIRGKPYFQGVALEVASRFIP